MTESNHEEALRLARENLAADIDTAHDGWCREDRLALARALLASAEREERMRKVTELFIADCAGHPASALLAQELRNRLDVLDREQDHG